MREPILQKEKKGSGKGRGDTRPERETCQFLQMLDDGIMKTFGGGSEENQ